MDIQEFLLARIAEDEAVARAATGEHWECEPGSSDVKVLDGPHLMDYPDMADQDAAHIAHWDPHRALAECAAKQAIISGLEPFGPWDDMFAPEILGTLAAVYADHPDYQEEWKP